MKAKRRRTLAEDRNTKAANQMSSADNARIWTFLAQRRLPGNWVATGEYLCLHGHLQLLRPILTDTVVWMMLHNHEIIPKSRLVRRNPVHG